MTARVDPLEQPEPLSRPLALSLAFHAFLFGSTFIWAMFDTSVLLGDPTGTPGGAVTVNVVQGVPLPRPRSAVKNPVANPVEHNVPAAPEPPEPKAAVEEPEPEAVPIETEKKKSAPKPTVAQKARQRKKEPPPSNQVGSSTGARVNSPILGGQQQPGGTGGVGFGAGSPFGARFGWYAEALQRRLAGEWRKTLSQVTGGSSKAVVVSFLILANGTIDRIQLQASSGNRSLDYSAIRAVHGINPMQPLPRGLGKRYINVEMTFRLD